MKNNKKTALLCPGLLQDKNILNYILIFNIEKRGTKTHDEGK